MYSIIGCLDSSANPCISEIDILDQIIDGVIVKHGSVFFGNLNLRICRRTLPQTQRVNVRGFCFFEGPDLRLVLAGIVFIHLFLPHNATGDELRNSIMIFDYETGKRFRAYPSRLCPQTSEWPNSSSSIERVAVR
jgi:hypothetical protein